MALDVITTFTTWSSVSVDVEKLEELPPAATLSTYHWYVGALPPLMAVAVKVTLVPGQMLSAFGAIVTDGVTNAFTAMVTVLLVTVAGFGHTASDVISTVTLSPLARVALVKLLPPLPAALPLTNHW